MGPNRQRRPDAGRGGRGGRGGARGHARRFHHRLSNDPANPAAAMSSTSRDMIIDVLHHVASAGRVAVSEKHFDVTQQAVVTFHKNSSATPAAQAAFLNLFSDIKPTGFGFAPTLVAAAAESILAADPILQRTVKHWSDILTNHGPLVANLVNELFALQLWSERPEGAREQTLAALEALSDDDLDGLETSCNEEVEQLQQLFEDNIIMMEAAVEDDAMGPGGDDSDDDREILLALRTQDGVDVLCCIRLPEGYPMNPPTVTFQPRRGKHPAPLEEKSLRQLGSAARKQLIQTAVATINGFEGMPCLVALVHALIETASNITGKVPELKTLPTAESDRARQMRDLEESGAQKKRRAFVAKLTSGGRGGAPSAEGSGRGGAGGEEDNDDEETDRFILPAKVELATVNTAEQAKARVHTHEGSSALKRNPRVDIELQEKWQLLRKTGSLMPVREKLPAMACREQIRSILANHSVLVVSGETGSGKTTQVPQYLFEFMCEESRGSACNIVCTQPRRLAATSVALRVAEERDEAIGETVGYSIRLENKCSAATRILYCTTGIILRRMQTDKVLAGVSHIVVDEIHERGVDTDFLLILLKDLLQRRGDLKLILMSATMSTELFSRYFGGAPIVSIAGRTHPVQVYHLEKIVGMIHYIVEDNSPYAAPPPSSHYANHSGGAKSGAAPPAARNKNKKLFELAPDDGEETGVEEERDIRRLRDRLIAADPSNTELAESDVSTLCRMNLDVINYELIERIVAYICTQYRFDGAILVFLPGMAEIQKCHEELRCSPDVMKRCVVYNLHSSLESKDQHAIFRKPPAGTRKVILGTNIMETSITIDDAVFVIDCGKHKENQYDARKSLSKLVTTTVSKANCRQRQGRAGRVRPGICFRLFTSAQFAEFDDHQLCEMHRVPLESLVLQIYTLNLGDEMEYLSKALSPPEEKAVKASVKVLTHLGALTAEKRLTSLGQHLANLPLDVKIGKMIIHGAVMQCLDPVLTIAACYSVRSPFLASVEQQPEVEAIRRAYAAGSASDSLASWNVYRKWISIAVGDVNSVASKTFCRDNYVSLSTLLQIQAMKRQYERYLAEAGFVSVGDLRPHDKRRSHQHFLFEPYRTLDDIVYEAGGPHNNVHSGLSKVIVACLVAGMYPNVAKVTPKKPSLHSSSSSRRQGNLRIATFDGSEVVIHPSSVASRETQFPSPLLLYADKVQTSLTFVREITVITPLHVILFGASTSMEYKAPFGELVVDDVTAFKCAPDEAVLLKSLKDQFDSALRVKINEPSTVWETVSHTVVRAIVKLLREEGSATRGSMVVATPGQTPPLTAPKASGGDGSTARSDSSAAHGSSSGAVVSTSPAPAAAPPAATPYYVRNKTCFNCGELGHLSRQCPNPAPPKTRGAATVRCFICGQWHHPNECPHTRSPKQRGGDGAAFSSGSATVA